MEKQLNDVGGHNTILFYIGTIISHKYMSMCGVVFRYIFIGTTRPKWILKNCAAHTHTILDHLLRPAVRNLVYLISRHLISPGSRGRSQLSAHTRTSHTLEHANKNKITSVDFVRLRRRRYRGGWEVLSLWLVREVAAA